MATSTDRHDRMATEVPAREREGRFTRDEGSALPDPKPVPRQSLRARLRANPATRLPYRAAVFVAGLLLIGVGVGLAAFPGPLTIPPVLAGLWVWSTEFAFAERLFNRFKAKAQEAWEHAKRRPVPTAAVTLGGLLAAGAAFWAVQHYELVDRAKAALT
jgi:hypothetical protein